MIRELTINTHKFVESSMIYGPGKRWVLWTQGCTLACRGCWNTQTWAKHGGKEISISTLVESITCQEDIEGITILGGEPFQQLDGIAELIKSVKQLGLTVMLYTGYEKAEFNDLMWQCFNSSDLVIAGRYRNDLRDVGLVWRGSTNQILESPTGYYDVTKFEESQEVEIHIDHETNQVTLTGYPDLQIIEMINQLTNSHRLGKSKNTS